MRRSNLPFLMLAQPAWGDGFYRVALKFTSQILGQTFVEKNAHSGGLWNFSKHRLGGLFQKSNGLRSRNRWELLQKFVQRVAGFEIIEQVAHGDARAGKTRRAAHDFRVNYDNGLRFHGNN